MLSKEYCTLQYLFESGYSSKSIPCGSAGKEPNFNGGDQSSIPGFGKIPLEKGKATHSSILAWRIPWIA